MDRVLCFVLTFTCLLALSISPLSAQTGQTDVLAAPGDPIPDGPGDILYPGNFGLSNGGAAYEASLENVAPGTGTNGVYSSTLAGSQVIFRTNDILPGGETITGVYGNGPVINPEGDVAIYCAVDNNFSIVEGNGTYLKLVAETGSLGSPDDLCLNDQGDVAFTYFGPEGGNLAYISQSNGTLSLIAQAGEILPGGTDSLLSCETEAINNNDQVLLETQVQEGNDVYRVSTSDMIRIAGAKDPVPGSTWLLGDPEGSALNTSGMAVFDSTLFDSQNTYYGTGIFTGSGGPINVIAIPGQPSPDGGFYLNFDDLHYINDLGQVAFIGVSDVATNIIVGDGVTSKVIAQVNTSAPSGGDFTALFSPRVNNTGTVAFAASTNYNQTFDGIYLSDGTQTITVARVGDQINGKAITLLGFDPKAYNDFQEVAYQAEFSDRSEEILLFIPNLSWRTTGNGNWDTATNWTVSLQPGQYNTVNIAPSKGGIITGSMSPRTVQSLTLGGNAKGTSSLALQTSGILTVASGVTVGKNGSAGGNGTIVGSVLVQSGGMTSPGGPYTTNLSSVHYANGSNAAFVINSTRTSNGIHSVKPGLGGDYDQIALTSSPATSLQIDSGATLLIKGTSATYKTMRSHAGQDYYFLLVSNGGISSGQFTSLSVATGAKKPQTVSLTAGVASVSSLGLKFILSYTGSYANNSLVGGNDVVMTVASIPKT